MNSQNPSDADFGSAGADPAGVNAEPIAIIGLACRVPGAADSTEFWRNLAGGVESIRICTRQEQAALGVPEHWLQDPYFVPASADVGEIEGLDAAFFGMSAAEAELRDPQHRLFLELAYTALEDSGYDPARYPGEVAVYAGSGEDAYQWLNTRRDPKAFAAAAPLGLAISSHPDYIATFTSFKLDLRGPSMTVHTACSTSLVAVHLGCEALRNGECDMALAGAVNMDLPLGWGYMYFDGAIYSPDGHTRAFDERAGGTMWSDGGGVIVLKRLSEALADGDRIRAVVLGNAINNDGRNKVGFTAPSEEGQAAVIAQAIGVCGVDPRTISYLEAHGTGTAIGDPIEVAALSRVYRRYSADAGWCAIGSVKTNIGHLGPAAGVAGVIKTVLAMEHGMIPASLNFEKPNPKIDFAKTPFRVSTELSRWARGPGPRRAAVSSFGVGGTNAHVILEEAPPVRPERTNHRPVQLLQLSARTPAALTAAAQRLAGRLTDAEDDLPLADVAYTLRAGRRRMPQRLAVVATDATDAASALGSERRRITGVAHGAAPRVAFMFPGQGAQYPGMGGQLYRTEPAFRAAIDECCELLAQPLGVNLRDIMFAAAGDGASEDRLRQTAITQPALFTIEYALARLWQSWGVQPAAMVGHSIGEFVAAALAGVYSLPDALRVVTARGELMQQMPAGAMLAVQLDEAEVRARLPETLSLAAVNGPGSVVVAGPVAEVAAFAGSLDHAGVGNRPLRTSHAFHSSLMEPVLPRFHAVVADVPLHPPRLEFLSGLTGDWVSPSAVTDPSYWTRQLREPVRFGDCLSTLLSEEGWLLLECGPGRQLCGLARLQRASQVTSVPSLPGPMERKQDIEALYAAVGKLWTSGVEPDKHSFGEPGRRVPLPSYPWERKPYWIRPGSGTELEVAPQAAAARPVDAWFAVPAWQQLPPAELPPADEIGRCLVFTSPDGGAGGGGSAVATLLAAAGAEVVTVRQGKEFGRDSDGHYTVRPAARADYDALAGDLARAGIPSRIVHAWTLDGPPAQDATATWQAQDRGFFSLLCLVQALAQADRDSGIRVDILTAGVCDVTGADLVRPEHATVAGITRVAPLELPWLSIRHLDLDPQVNLAGDPRAARQLMIELTAGTGHDAALAGPEVVLRAGRRWRREYRQVASIGRLPAGPGLRDGGVYLITGGLGGIGITIAEDLARHARARLVLVSRSGLPPHAEWDEPASSGIAHGTRAARAMAAIRRMESQGAEVLVLAADVTTADGARQARRAAVDRFGRVDGIVHAAGVPGGGMTEVRDHAAARQVLRPKLLGALALRDAFSDLDLDFVVLCSSVTAITGGFGQVDYCAANNFLDAHARAAHGWRGQIVSANWGGWRDVGMAAEVTAPAAFRALQHGTRMVPLQHPVLTGRHDGSDDAPGWCSGVVSASTHWLLDEHRLAGVPVMPGTGYLELAHRAFTVVAPDGGGDRVAELRDVTFIEPMPVPDGRAAEVRVVFTEGADGLDFQVISVADGVRSTYATGTAAWVTPGPPLVADLEAIRRRCSPAPADAASGLLAFGPRWSSTRGSYAGNGERLTLLEANQTVVAELGQWDLHPALLDEATVSGWSGGDQRYLPLGYGSLMLRRPLTGRLWSHLRRLDTGTSEIVSFDITLYDDAGDELASIADFTMRRVDPRAMVAAVTAVPARTASAPGREAAAGDAAAPGAASENAGAPDAGAPDAGAPDAAARDAVAGRAAMTGPGSADGIRPADGAEAFRRLVSADVGPQVAITTLTVDELMAAGHRVTHETVESGLGPAGSAAEPRPGEGHVAPRTELEAAIARLWGEVLGGEQVGVTDDFFEAGGNSLVAVQLIALIRRELGVRLPMRALFEDPTVAGAAARVAGLREGR